jgi:peptidoglycan/xylan/chitin deacetylase (PgdA/CDA1 family)
MKKILFAVLYRLGVTKFAAWWNRDRVAFLCYHGVTKQLQRRRDDPKGLHVHHSRFAAHLDFLQRHYNIVSLSDYMMARAKGSSLGPYSVVLTFDDGFRNFLTVAAPILAARRIPATVFLITDRTGEEPEGGRNPAWTTRDDRRYLSWWEARELKEKHGFEFGSHTCSHSRLVGLSAADTDRELLHSFDQLVTHLGIERPGLSYPKGEYSNLLAAEARKVGYAFAVTTDRGFNEMDHDRFTLGRTLIGNNDDRASFAVRVSGLRWWLVRIVREHVRFGPTMAKPTEKVVQTGEPGLQLGD